MNLCSVSIGLGFCKRGRKPSLEKEFRKTRAFACIDIIFSAEGFPVEAHQHRRNYQLSVNRYEQRGLDQVFLASSRFTVKKLVVHPDKALT